jgi:glycosyltransferase involved in cell wall biosynthesis
MQSIHELTVYTTGPAGDYRTWSNVPYFFTESLRAQGVRVNLVDIAPPFFVERTFNLTFRLMWKLFHPTTTFTYFRSWLHFLITSNRIRKAGGRYPNSQADIFLTFSFSSNRRVGHPVVLLCDWPYSYSIKYFQDRSPDFLEARSIAREDGRIEEADLVISLFQSGSDEMERRYRNNNIFCLGPAINVPSAEISPTLPELKAGSFNLLFIGDAKYLAGLRVLIQSYELLKASFPELTLSIIGQETSQLGWLPEGVISYGYLDKGDESSRDLFYSLMQKAKAVVNTTPRWGGFSSILEALAYYTPVVVAPFHEIVRLFGKENDFISYCEENTPDLLAERIRVLLEHPDYPDLARRAHAAVENFTWENYVGRLLNLMEKEL